MYTYSVQLRIRILVMSGCNSFGQGINIEPVAM